MNIPKLPDEIIPTYVCIKCEKKKIFSKFCHMCKTCLIHCMDMDDWRETAQIIDKYKKLAAEENKNCKEMNENE
jgi:hypothetical protein